jgi:uncharacterized SAM-binding protein YcdF (DUF218 family)
MSRRAWAIVVALVAVSALAVQAAATALILWPESDVRGRADAVVVLAGGGGERLAEGVRLMERRVAPILVISHGREPGWTEANRLCDGEARFEVVCFTPEPERTQGEARAVRTIAKERGWRSLVVVTSTYHVTRARLLFERCIDGDVRAAAAEPHSPRGLPSAGEVVHEWAGYAHALLVQRDC